MQSLLTSDKQLIFFVNPSRLFKHTHSESTHAHSYFITGTLLYMLLYNLIFYLNIAGIFHINGYDYSYLKSLHRIQSTV